MCCRRHVTRQAGCWCVAMMAMFVPVPMPLLTPVLAGASAGSADSVNEWELAGCTVCRHTQQAAKLTKAMLAWCAYSESHLGLITCLISS